MQVYRVGVVKDLLVSHEHCKGWFLNSDPSREDSDLVSYRPWMSLGSRDPHLTSLAKYRHAVYSHILTHPGITMVSTCVLGGLYY